MVTTSAVVHIGNYLAKSVDDYENEDDDPKPSKADREAAQNRKNRDALRAHNDVARRAAKAVGGLNADQMRRLHDEITGQNFDYEQIFEIAKAIKGS
jgi:hypothetical protein